MKVIKAIDVNARIKAAREYSHDLDGVRITYEDGSFTEFGIESGLQCCELWDYLHSVDEPGDYVGARVLSVEEVDTWPTTIEKVDGYELGFQAIRVTTDRGLMDFVVYNDHNGFYSHATIFRHDGKEEADQL